MSTDSEKQDVLQPSVSDISKKKSSNFLKHPLFYVLLVFICIFVIAFGFSQKSNTSPLSSKNPTTVSVGSVAGDSVDSVSSTSQVNGLKGEYYDNTNFTGKSVTRYDSLINFSWWFGPPIKGIQEETFSVRWTGKLMPKYSEKYTFYVKADDGAKLWVDNKLLIDKWVNTTPTTEHRSEEVMLEAGKKYDIKVEYYEEYWWEEISLSWSSSSTPKQKIPQSNLFTVIPPLSLGDSNSCIVKDAKFLGSGNNPDFSPDSTKLAYFKWDAKGVYQLYISNPDGSSEKCISCTQVPGAPLVDRHKIGPSWHPSGRFIAVTGEMDKHPAVLWSKIGLISELFVNGLWSNIYVTTSDGLKWYKLTNYTNTREDGAMHINFSPDGKKIAWSRLIDKASDKFPFGNWDLMIADFVVNTQGVPSLQNVQDITPANAGLVEAHGFSPDNSKVAFTGDMENTHKWGMDIFTKDLVTGTVTNLTKGDHWEEHATYSPSGKKIVYMSSEPLYPKGTELMIMNSDGSNKRTITHFNAHGYLESTPEQVMATSNDWNSDGTRIAVTQQFSFKYPTTQMVVLTFAGQCGN